MTFDFPWWAVALLYLIVIASYFGIGATLGFLFTYLTLRPMDKADDEQKHFRSTALGFSTLGALAGGTLNFLRARRHLFAPSALATGFLAVALIVRTNLDRAERGQELDAPYLASLSADAVPPPIAGLSRLPERDRSAVEAGLEARWTGPAQGDWRTYNRSRSRAREAVPTGLLTGPRAEASDSRGDA